MIEVFIVLFCVCFFGYLGYLGYILYRKKCLRNDSKAPLEDVVTQRESSNDVFKDMRSLKYFSAAQWMRSRGASETMSWSSSGTFGSDKTNSIYQPSVTSSSAGQSTKVHFVATPPIIITTPVPDS